MVAIQGFLLHPFNNKHENFKSSSPTTKNSCPYDFSEECAKLKTKRRVNPYPANVENMVSS
jgi:hypothetical protein